mgnify:CR=1 FL=1
MLDKILDFVLKKEVIGPVIVLLVSWILYKIIKKILKKFLDFRGKLEVKRKNTLFYLFKGIVKDDIEMLPKGEKIAKVLAKFGLLG